ncbi:MAG TPA: four helix bundle protein [bacterium]|nr:four helix bundle protein [bacterium]
MENTKITKFTDLNAWKESHKLVLEIYKITKDFPKEEMYGLVSQLRRCVISISSNIAEGFSRHTFKDKANFYSMALGSTTELQNQILVARDVGYITQEKFIQIANQTIVVHKLINGLIKYARAHNT